MHYGSWLTLKVPELKDEATAKKVKETLAKQRASSVLRAIPGNTRSTSSSIGEWSRDDNYDELLDAVATHRTERHH